MPRRSSISSLDPELLGRLHELLRGGHTLDAILADIATAFPDERQPSRSALGRYARNMEEIGRDLRASREVARVWAQELGREPEGDIGKVTMELLRTLSFDTTVALRNVMRNPANPEAAAAAAEPLKSLALTMQRLEAASFRSLEREKALRQAALEDAARALKKAGRRRGLSDEAIAEIEAELRLL